MGASPENEKTCFIAMPVATTPAQAERYGDPKHWEHVMDSLFVPAVEAAGFTAWRPVAKGSHLIHATIVSQLEQADMVLVDMSESNPNVFFELGVRTSVNKPIALVRSDESTPIPFDVSGINTHTYDPALKAWHIEKEIKNLAEHLKDAESSCEGENPMWRQFGLTIKAQEPTSKVSPEDARLEVVTHQLDQVIRRMNIMTSDEARMRPAARRYDDDYLELGNGLASRIEEHFEAIADIGKKHGVPCDVEFNQGEGFVIHHGMAPNPVAYDNFKAELGDYLAASRLPHLVRETRRRSKAPF